MTLAPSRVGVDFVMRAARMSRRGVQSHAAAGKIPSAAKLGAVTKAVYHQLKLENMTLRDALREANNELRRHRLVIGSLAGGQAQVTDQVMRIFSKDAQR